MSLFEVPGWSVSAPVPEISSKRSRKRKHHSEKLIDGLSHKRPRASYTTNVDKSSKKVDQHSSEPSLELQKAFESSPTFTPMKTKRKPKNLTRKDKPAKAPTRNSAPENQMVAFNSLTLLQKNMKESLDGARFRLINESLYKSESHEARSMMQQDPKVFDEYHIGFRHQVHSWPTNPVDHYLSKFSSYSRQTIVADLGCGDATLAKRLVPQGISVISFDLVSDRKFVVEADICDRIPLPGSEGVPSEKSMGEGQVVDVVVCALSLMSTNWVNCLREAWRILKAGGQLHIAEVTSRFTDVEQFVSAVGTIGFRLNSRDDANTHFMLFEFTKIARSAKSEKEWAKLVSKGNILKPCEYKRR